MVALTSSATHDVAMFTLEDMDFAAELEAFRSRQPELFDLLTAERHVTPEADARFRPTDYFIAGW